MRTTFKTRYLALVISLIALAGIPSASASDTLSDAMSLIRSGVSEDVIVAWAARQRPLEPTKEAMDALIQAKVSGRVAQALLIGNTRPGWVPQKSAVPAKPAEESVKQQAQPDDGIVIQPAARDAVAPDSTVVVDGGVTYYPDVYYSWPYSYWTPYWTYGTYGYGWPYWRGGWRDHDRWNHGDWHNGQHDGRRDGFSGYRYGSGQFNNIRHEQTPASQSVPQHQAHMAQSYVPTQNQGVTTHQSYSSGVNSHVYSGTVYSHGNAGGYSGGHSYSGGGFGGGHSYGGGHGFGGGGHGGGRR